MKNNLNTALLDTENLISTSNSISQILVNKYGEGAHRLPICFVAAEILVNELTEKGFEAEHLISVSATKGQHSLILIRNLGYGTIIDQAWKQFLPQKLRQSSTAPNVLIGSAHTIVKKVQNHGVHKDDLAFWNTNNLKSFQEIRNADLIAERASEEAFNKRLAKNN